MKYQCMYTYGINDDVLHGFGFSLQESFDNMVYEFQRTTRREFDAVNMANVNFYTLQNIEIFFETNISINVFKV